MLNALRSSKLANTQEFTTLIEYTEIHCRAAHSPTRTMRQIYQHWDKAGRIVHESRFTIAEHKEIPGLTSCTEACFALYAILLDEENKIQPYHLEPIGPHIYRHCDKTGRIVHLSTYSIRSHKEYKGLRDCGEACCIAYRIQLDRENIVQVEIPDGSPMNLPSTMVPILAGHLQDGREAFICEIFSKNDNIEYRAVAKETRPRELSLYHSGRRRWTVIDRINVFVLKYPPNTYQEILEHAKPRDNRYGDIDKTGVYGWTFVDWEEAQTYRT